MSTADGDQTNPPPPPADFPLSYPIKTLEDLESRAYFDSSHFPFNKSRVPLQWNKLGLKDRPRLLVCHDMQGGYAEDKWIQGGVNADAYAIWHWHLIDVFVYFSHNLVTLPPPCWTDTAHRHGVKVLGTFIAEWGEGKTICSQLLSTKEPAKMYAERLAELAVALGFDGWLINIEVVLDAGQIPNLKEFVSHLTHVMHSSVPGSLVIWYDSVTISGKLSYQNQLNENNKLFFDICDGIFVNYAWKEDYPMLSANTAGDRKFDVYMGIDVFGRGTYGGGQWTTSTGLQKIKENNISAAIFAPGWVYENLEKDQFVSNQNKWWGEVEKSWEIIQKYPKSLPFYSNFDQGRGYHFAVEGRHVSSVSWNNISCQGLQPHLEHTNGSASDEFQVLVDLKEASYNGGGNLTLKGKLKDGENFQTMIFHGELDLTDSPLDFSYSVKSEENSLFGLSLEFISTKDGKESYLLAPLTMIDISSNFNEAIMPRQVRKPETESGWVLMDYTIRKSGWTLTKIHAVCYGSASLAARYDAVIGHIAIKNSGESSGFHPATSWLVESEILNNSGSKISVKIAWRLRDSEEALFLRFYIYVLNSASKEDGNDLENRVRFLGVAHVQAFLVSNIDIPSDASSLRFVIQACATDGTCQKLNECPAIEVNLR